MQKDDDAKALLDTLPPALGFQVLELVVGQLGRGDLSWALGGQGRGTRRGIKLWPPARDTSKHGEINSLLLSEKDVRDIDVEGPGYAMKEGLLGDSALQLLRDEVGKIFEDGHLQPAAMISQDQRRWAVAGARGDWQMWLDMACLDEVGHAWWANWPQLRAACRRLRQVQEELSRAWGLGQGRLQAQLACYPGGGARYVRHLDAQPIINSNASDQRRLTMLYYINPGWVTSDGGCLRLYPHNQEDSQSEMFVDVAPLGDRLLLFQSQLSMKCFLHMQCASPSHCGFIRTLSPFHLARAGNLGRYHCVAFPQEFGCKQDCKRHNKFRMPPKARPARCTMLRWAAATAGETLANFCLTPIKDDSFAGLHCTRQTSQ